MTDTYYKPEDLPRFEEIGKEAPELARKFFDYYNAVFAEGELTEREKAVEALVKPIRDALEASNKQISELEKARSEAYGGIRSQLEAMQLNQQSLTQETKNLVNALRRPEVATAE